MGIHGGERDGDGGPGARARTEEALRELVLRHRPDIFFAGDLQIRFHRNVCTMASLARKGPRVSLRLHELFTRAPQEVLEAVVRSFFTRRGRAQAGELRALIFDFLDRCPRPAAACLAARGLREPCGRVYDLKAEQEAIRREYLPQCPRVDIGWSSRVSSTLMGKWIPMPKGVPNVVVVNPLLDDARVPRYYVQYVVFHELLHEIIPIQRERGRWVHHPVEFRRRERQFPHFDRAVRWERKNVVRLFQTYLRRKSGHGRADVPCGP
jgi:hypothetical protein